MEKGLKAASVGVRHLSLESAFVQMRGLMEGGAVIGPQAVIDRIDNLTALEVGREDYLRYPGMLRSCSGTGDSLERIAKAVEIHLRELERMVAQAAPAQDATVIGGE